MEQEFISTSIEETHKISRQVAREVKPGDVLALHGELGAGKTTFMQGFANALGITRRITSPTFVIMQQYRSEEQNLWLYHIDLYRIESEEDIRSLDLEELFEDEQSIVAIEWAEKVAETLPLDTLHLHFESLDEERKKIGVRKQVLGDGS